MYEEVYSYVSVDSNGKIISEILWYHMRLDKSRAYMHCWCWWVESYVIMWIGVYALVEYLQGWFVNLLNCILVEIWWTYAYIGLYGEHLYSDTCWIPMMLNLSNQLKLILSFIFHLIMIIVDYELTPSGRLVDRLPYPYGWVDGVRSSCLRKAWSFLVYRIFRSLVCVSTD